MKNTLLALLLAPALLASCESAKKAATAPTPTGRSQHTEGITNKYWKLVTLEGQPVTMAPGQELEAYFMLKDSSRVTGFGGCNVLNGRYELKESQLRLRFTNMLTTLKACPGPNPELGFLQVLNQTDNYTRQGDTLRLNVGRRAPLAVFHAVYFKCPRATSWLLAGLIIATMLHAHAPSGPPYPPAASDPLRLSWMPGFPPPPDKVLRVDDGSFRKFPALRWSVVHRRRLLPTVDVSPGRAISASGQEVYLADYTRIRKAVGH